MNERNTLQKATTDDDLLPVVNERDELIGVQTRRNVHLKRLRHRAVHVAVFDPGGRLWLQQRAMTKDTWPGAWDLSATGHVDPGETYDAAARRELKEELGIDAEPTFILKLPATEQRGWEFHALYLLHWPGAIDDFNRDEVQAMRSFAIAELQTMLEASDPALRLTPGVGDALPHLIDALRAGGTEQE